VLKDTILAVLNAEARSLGAEPVIDRALEDWIFEDLFKGPIDKGLSGGGSEWRYSPAALKAALEVIRLKAQSPKRRNTVLRIRLWLLSFHVPMDRIKKDLRSEYRRLLRRHFFRNPFHHDASSGEGVSEPEKERERRRAGPFDPTFGNAGWEVPRDDILRLVWEMVSDPAKQSHFLKVLDQLVSPYVSEKGRASVAGFLKGVEPYGNVAGLFGAPDEIGKSGLKALAAIGEVDLMKGRRLYQFALAMADCAARADELLPPNVAPALGETLSKIALSLCDSDEWCVAGLAVCSIAVARAKSAT
jgi:hypothetical protein